MREKLHPEWETLISSFPNSFVANFLLENLSTKPNISLHQANNPPEGIDMHKTIAMFNHKGGVSKTTTTFNLSWMLAEMGKTVVMVDADPQCNLTGLVVDLSQGGDLDQNDHKSPAIPTAPWPDSDLLGIVLYFYL